MMKRILFLILPFLCACEPAVKKPTRMIEQTKNKVCNAFAPYGFPTGQDRGFMLCHEHFAINYDGERRVPNWVAERLYGNEIKVWLKSSERKENLRDDALLVEKYQPELEGYNLTRSYRAMALAATRNYLGNQKAMSQTYYGTNTVPLTHAAASQWDVLNRYVRNWAMKYDEVITVSGVIDSKTTLTKSKNSVTIPTHIYKLIYFPKFEQNIAFIIPNSNMNAQPLQNYQTTLAKLEKQTGLRFYSLVDEDDRKAILHAIPNLWK